MKTFTFLLFTVFAGFSVSASGSEPSTFDHSIWNDLLKKHVSDQGNVNYKALQSEQATLKSYLELVSNTSVNEKIWSKDEQLAFWINAYNAFTVQLILNHYPVKSIKKIKSPWDKPFFKIGGKAMSLNHIEHQILRAKFQEPRIHFAIVCASFSCPTLLNQAFTASNVQKLMNQQAIRFVNDPKRNKLSSKKVELSEIFSWFKGDFTKKGSLINFINQYAKVKVNEKAKVSFLPYNWNLNE